MTTVLSVFDPTAPSRKDVRQERRVLDSLKGKRVGFIDNTKPNFNFLVDDLAERLLARHGVKSIVKQRKRTAGMPATDEIIDDIAEQCDVVIAGSGD